MSRILEPTSKEELLVDVPSRDDLSSLLDLAFGLAPGSHFLSDFPVWDLDLSVPDVRIFGNFEFGRLRAACGIRLVNLRVGFRGDQPHFSLKVAVLGAVCSHPEWRRKGLASELISEAVQWAKGQGAAAVFLWGSTEEFYRRFGFQPCGRQLRVPLASLLRAAPAGDCSLSKIQQGLTPEVFNLLLHRSDGIAMGSADWNWFASHRNVRWYYLERAGRVTAYAALGRGIDLEGHVHEWGGSPSDLLALFDAILKEHPETILLGPADRRFPLRMEGQGTEEFLCMAKVLDPDLILRSLSGTPGMGSSVHCERIGEVWKFSDPEGSIEVEEFDLPQFLFGKPEEALGQPLVRQRPLVGLIQLWFWGLDAA